MTDWQDTPNLLQRTTRKVIALGPVSAVLSQMMYRLDDPVLR
ncbi:MAG: hypothetical protein R3C44_10615 [Chloroflexota bacterium]